MCLQHAYIIIATHAISHIYFCNVQIKHLKHKSGTPETLNTTSPRCHVLPCVETSACHSSYRFSRAYSCAPVRSAAASPTSLLLGRSRPKTSARGGRGTARPTMGHGAVWDRRAVGEGGAAGQSAAGVCLMTPRHQCECECGNFRRWKRRRGVVGPIQCAGLVRHVKHLRLKFCCHSFQN